MEQFSEEYGLFESEVQKFMNTICEKHNDPEREITRNECSICLTEFIMDMFYKGYAIAICYHPRVNIRASGNTEGKVGER